MRAICASLPADCGHASVWRGGLAIVGEQDEGRQGDDLRSEADVFGVTRRASAGSDVVGMERSMVR